MQITRATLMRRSRVVLIGGARHSMSEDALEALKSKLSTVEQTLRPLLEGNVEQLMGSGVCFWFFCSLLFGLW